MKIHSKLRQLVERMISRFRIAVGVFAIISSSAIPAYAELWGDYNASGQVEAGDYIVYQKNLWTTNTIPNDITSGWVMPDDHTVWRENFGDTAGSGAGSSSSPAPEPSSLLLCAFLAPFLAMRYRFGR